jgi:lipopolysaccharide/colanic/teichoic acid biosynthesis glycosyltransferase
MTARQHASTGLSRRAIPPTPPVLLTRSRAGCVYDRYVKPVLDRMGASILLLLTLPVMLLVCLAVYVRLGRPVFFRQPRVGRGGVTFGMLKFRTMQPDRRRRQVPVNGKDRRRQHKSANDPRHTRLGRLLRRCSLDELPQLWNVLRGDMSLVGPRPELTSIVATYEDWQHQRHQVKPGLTGLWQVTDRRSSDGDMHLHTGTDLLYVEQISLWTDLRILLRTPVALTKGR